MTVVHSLAKSGNEEWARSSKLAKIEKAGFKMWSTGAESAIWHYRGTESGRAAQNSRKQKHRVLKCGRGERRPVFGNVGEWDVGTQFNVPRK